MLGLDRLWFELMLHCGEGTGPDIKDRNVHLYRGQQCPETCSQGWTNKLPVSDHDTVINSVPITSLQGLEKVISFCQGEKKKWGL